MLNRGNLRLRKYDDPDIHECSPFPLLIVSA
jgi:hypothetical protein